MAYGRFDFSDSVMYLKGVGPRKAAVLEKKLNIRTMYDLLTHYPRDYEDQSEITPIGELEFEQSAVIYGRLSNLQMRDSSRFKIVSGILTDKTGHIQLTWFNQEWIFDRLDNGMRLVVVGKVKMDSYSGAPVMNQISSFSILRKTIFRNRAGVSFNRVAESKFFQDGSNKFVGQDARPYRNFAEKIVGRIRLNVT